MRNKNDCYVEEVTRVSPNDKNVPNEVVEHYNLVVRFFKDHGLINIVSIYVDDNDPDTWFVLRNDEISDEQFAASESLMDELDLFLADEYDALYLEAEDEE